MKFTLPKDVVSIFKNQIRNEMIISAFNLCESLSITYVRKPLPRKFTLPIFCSGSWSGGANPKLVAVDVRTSILSEAIDAQQKKAIATLENRINNKLEEGEEITHIDLAVDDQRMISGTVEGDGFKLNVKSIWNYRYGENSANGILTVYAQTRVNRQES